MAPTSAQGEASRSGCLALVGDRRLRKELMLRNLFSFSDPTRPLRLEGLSLLDGESFVFGRTEALSGEGPGVVPLSIKLRSTPEKVLLGTISIFEWNQEGQDTHSVSFFLHRSWEMLFLALRLRRSKCMMNGWGALLTPET